MTPNSFEHNNLYIRLIEKEDLEILRQHRNDYKTWINLTDINLIYKEQQELWYTKLIQDKTKKYFMAYSWVTENQVTVNENIGVIRIDEIDSINRSARVGCDVFKSFRNRGLGTKIMEAICAYSFNFLNMHRLWLLVASYNMAAIEIYKRTGFLEEGCQKQALYRNGTYHDYIMMSYLNPKEIKI